MYIYVYTYTYICIYMYVYTYIHVCVCVCVYNELGIPSALAFGRLTIQPTPDYAIIHAQTRQHTHTQIISSALNRSGRGLHQE